MGRNGIVGFSRIVFVVNPVSGRVATRKGRRQRIEKFIADRDLHDEAVVLETERAGHAEELAREAVRKGAEVVVSVGGDGTMNEVARALVNQPASLALIPLGSGNGLGRDLGIPMGFDEALRVVVDGKARVIDTGTVNGFAFFNVMGTGFDAELGRLFNASRRRGFMTYLRIGLRTYFRYRGDRYKIDGVGEIPAFVLAVANSTQYGNNARIAPRARLDDGQLNLAAITSGNILRTPSLVWRLFSGSIDRSSSVRSVAGERFVIERPGAGPIHTDGEIHETAARLDIRVVPQSLRVLVPDK